MLDARWGITKEYRLQLYIAERQSVLNVIIKLEIFRKSFGDGEGQSGTLLQYFPKARDLQSDPIEFDPEEQLTLR